MRGRRGGASIYGVLLVSVFIPGLHVHRVLAFDPLNGDYSRDDVNDIRIVSYNHARNFIDDPGTDAEFDRILTALDPDIICFQEFVSGVSVSEVENRMNAIIPISGSWDVHFGLLGGIRTVIASRYPLSMTRIDTTPGSSTRGVTIALADLPDNLYAKDVYLMGVHLKCCGSPGGSEDDSRQESADAIANWLGDARGVVRPFGNHVVLPNETPIINLGDFNLVGGPQPEDTLITGDIQDNVGYGSDVKGDWDNSDMTDLAPTDPFTGDDFTWQGNGNFPPGRLDRIFYTDSVVTVANSFVLNTDTMTGSALAAAGLQSGDTLPENTSDHLPIAMDIRGFAAIGCVDDIDCSDGVYCNGAETCSGGQCFAGSPINCNDSISCTSDSCNEATDTCDNIPNHGNCSDGQYCNGDEVCDVVQGCLAGSPVSCDEGGECGVGSCNESTDSCDYVFDNALCDDGQLCNGPETCLAGTCIDGAPFNCEDGNDCTIDTCNEETDSCDYEVSDAFCDDGLYCNGVETCHIIFGCQAGTSISCADGVDCTVDTCNEITKSCDSVADNALCDDGLFCNGQETCDAVSGCQAGTGVVCDDGIACTVDGCNEGGNECTFVPLHATCNDGLFCNGEETCDPELDCVSGSPPCGQLPCLEPTDECLTADDIPTTSQWGLACLMLMMLAVGTLVMRRTYAS